MGFNLFVLKLDQAQLINPKSSYNLLLARTPYKRFVFPVATHGHFSSKYKI
jgi:hypothetical protein